MPMVGSASAPDLGKSPYASSVTRRPKRTGWAPPPGAMNEPEILDFVGPGPGRYHPKQQHSCLSTKPRVVACRFGSDDRLKYLGPQSALEESGKGTGIFGGANPTASLSPGPAYIPKYGLVHSASAVISFSSERRDTSGINQRAQSTAPGPGLYNPRHGYTKRNYTSGGGFLADDRMKYLGEIDPHSGTPAQSNSPGPLYKPSDAAVRRRAPGVAFGGRGPGTIKKPLVLKHESPGPGSYDLGTTLAHGAVLATKRSAASFSFGGRPSSGGGMVDSSRCFHGKVPVDMTNATSIDSSPGPGYKPSHDYTKPRSTGTVFGTSKRFTKGLAPVKDGKVRR